MLIGAYIRDELSHRVPGGLNWERWIRAKEWRTDRAISWTIPLLITFPGVSLISETWIFSYVFTRDHISVASWTLFIGAWLAGIIATVLCIYLVLGTIKDWHGMS